MSNACRSPRLHAISCFILMAIIRTGWAMQPQPLPPDPPAVLYRYDDRGPDIVFDQGFSSVGRDMNLLNHVLGVGMYRAASSEAEARRSSAFVATTARESVVRRMARGRLQPTPGDIGERRVWIYVIRATNRFFGVIRSLQRAMDRMEDCELTGQLQARVLTLDGAMNTARGESEWVAYRYIPPTLISHATQYRLAADGHEIEAVPNTRVDNPRYIPADTHGNTTPWFIDALPNPATTVAYRVYNQARAAAMSLQDRLRNATFGAQFCGIPASSSRSERSVSEAPPDSEIDAEIDRVTEIVLGDELHDRANSRVCAILPFQTSTLPDSSPGSGTCEDPEAIGLSKLPVGYAWVDDQIVPTTVPWASWNVDDAHGIKNRPIFCKIDPGLAKHNVLNVMCEKNEQFTDFVIQLKATSGWDVINIDFRGKTGSPGVELDPTQIPLGEFGGGWQPRMLADVAHGNPRRQDQMIQEVFNTRDWNASIIVAPVYTPEGDAHPAPWIHDELRF
ncbi:hypothetical protein [Trinickia fusca]|uniref:Uncharacterized protein n=1 Tax=Trinickia fusca TaxID=2419777 RepID=A0A494XBM3_9BURK|nr:hypothetical protein [Trinickia fusca]RKP48155.1 hypothetical protein D7S89_12470 [Trinickia fusca]